MSKFLYAALNNRDITIYGDGSQTRTFCYVEDNVGACLKAFYENKIVNEVINIGGESEITMLELANLIIELSGSSSKIIHLPKLKDGDMTRRCPDNSKMKDLLDREMLPLKEGILKLLESKQFVTAV